MTSSDRHLLPNQSRWDFGVQRYKSHRDVFCEKDLFSILVLACGRPEVTRLSVLSTIEALKNCPLEIEWIFMENGLNEENYDFFKSLSLNRKVIIRQANFGINEALNQMWAVSRGEFCMVHENDWINRLPDFDFISASKEIFEIDAIDIVQLRAIWDPSENWGLHKPMYNPWSCDRNKLGEVKVIDSSTSSGHSFLAGCGFYGFNNNPTIIRKRLYRSCGPYPEADVGTDPRHGETLYQEQVLKTGCFIAHVGREVYYHGGQVATKVN